MRKYKYKWNLSEGAVFNDSLRRNISSSLGVTEVTSQLLMNRGCMTPSDADSFISKSEVMLHDPFLLANMDIAAGKILEAAQNNEKIIVYGDYDVDGVTSVCTLLTYLEKIDKKYLEGTFALEDYEKLYDIVKENTK